MLTIFSIAVAALVVTASSYSGKGTPAYTPAGNDTSSNSTLAAAILVNTTMNNSTSSPVTTPLYAHRIVCVGDSITEGFADPNNWPFHLKARLGGDWEVIDNGVGGATTADMQGRIDAALELHPRYVILSGGINDLARGEPLEAIKGNIETMCTKVDSYGAVPVLCTITPTGDYPVQKDALNAWITEYAHSNGYPLIDFYVVLNDQSNPGHADRTLVFDGTHPNAAGYEAMANGIDLAIFTADTQNTSQNSTAASK